MIDIHTKEGCMDPALANAVGQICAVLEDTEGFFLSISLFKM